MSFGKIWCRVVASLTPDTLDVMVTNGETWRISIKNVPLDLRCPNAEFWIAWQSDLGDVVFRHAEDSTPERVIGS
jgi:hypothetical protein